MATAAQRTHMHAIMVYLLGKEPQIHYPPGDVRTALDLATFKLSEQQLHNLLNSGGKIQADCSEMVTEVCRWAGLQDPNGLNYRYPGYTGTLLAHLPHYTDPSRALLGALVVFGPGTGDHVCMVVEKGSDPLLFSHGQERGPLTIRLSVERSFHRAPVTFCSIQAL